MKIIALEDIKLRVFVDTNILIDLFVTPVPEVTSFIGGASTNDLIELVTSDYALWEQNEFIRKQFWIRHLTNSNKSFKEAINYRIRLTEPLREEVEAGIETANRSRDALNILNYNLMDQATPNSDFFSILQRLTAHSTIGSQDLLILLSAYVTKANAILTKDGGFTNSLSDVATLEQTIANSLLPPQLKNLKFINTLERSPQLYYNEWFIEKFDEYRIGRCISVYERANVIGVECEGAEEVSVGDYLLLTKISSEGEFKKAVFRVLESGLQDFETTLQVLSGKKATIKLPEDVQVERWMERAQLFHLESN